MATTSAGVRILGDTTHERHVELSSSLTREYVGFYTTRHIVAALIDNGDVTLNLVDTSIYRDGKVVISTLTLTAAEFAALVSAATDYQTALETRGVSIPAADDSLGDDDHPF